MRKLATVVAGLVVVCWAAGARSADPPQAVTGDPAPSIASGSAPPVDVPSLDFKPTSSDIDNYDEHYYFHKAGVGYGAALADIAECDSYSLALVPMSDLPTFAPVGGNVLPNDARERALLNAWTLWGPLGVGIAAIVMDDLQSDMQQANLRRCMQFKGYRRYGTSRAIWKKISKGTVQAFEQRSALIASGPQPTAEAIAP